LFYINIDGWRIDGWRDTLKEDQVKFKTFKLKNRENKIPKLVINRVYLLINFDPLCCQIIFIFSNIWKWYFRTCQFGIFHTRLTCAHIKVVTKLCYFLISNWYAFISNWYPFISNWYTFISDWYVCNININQFCFYFFASYKQINIK